MLHCYLFEDKHTEKSFEHRRQWFVERMHYLASVFNINICYAIMPNHYHLVLHIDEHQNESLADEEVCESWCQLYSNPVLVERWQSEQPTSKTENKTVLTFSNYDFSTIRVS